MRKFVDKEQDGLAVLVSLRNDGQLPWLIESLESVFGKNNVDSLYKEEDVTIVVGKKGFQDADKQIILEEIRKFDGVVIDEVEIYDHLT